MKNTIINENIKPFLGMQIFIKREDCIYVIHKMSDKRFYMSAISDYKYHKKMWSNIDCFDTLISVGSYKIVQA